MTSGGFVWPKRCSHTPLTRQHELEQFAAEPSRPNPKPHCTLVALGDSNEVALDLSLVQLSEASVVLFVCYTHLDVGGYCTGHQHPGICEDDCKWAAETSATPILMCNHL